MPTYDYYSEETEEEKEVIHGMNEEPEVFDSKGNKMKKVIKIGHGGFKMVADSTRRRDYGTRYGARKKKSDNAMTPTESADAKAKYLSKQKKKKNSNNPYAAFEG